ncbi:hypothetical protein [Gordonia aurantiaca]|uniref:hypothetical protein n=1 Tax=Gordonia sp. B21 TaxID=3151852 RepID=UPI0032668408
MTSPNWRPLPQVYANVQDPDSGLIFPYGFMLSASQTRELDRSGVLPAVEGLNIGAGGVSKLAKSMRMTIQGERLTETGGCLLIMYSPTALRNQKTGKMTHWVGRYYGGPPVCAP